MDSQAKQVTVPTQDLLTILSALQLVSSRGAIRPEEFVQIGTAYQNLYQFLVDLGAITPTQTKTDAPVADQPGNASA